MTLNKDATKGKNHWILYGNAKQELTHMFTALSMLDMQRQIGSSPDYKAVAKKANSLANFANMIANRMNELDTDAQSVVK